MTWRFSILFIALCCQPALAAGSDHLGQLTLAPKPVDLLDGRLMVRVPEQGQLTSIQHSIMAAPESNAEMSRIQIDAGKERMVLLASELFAQADGNFESGVMKRAAALTPKVRVEPWPLPPPLRAYACIPVTPTQNKEANLIFGLYVAQADGSVQELAFFINPAAATRPREATALAKAIAGTITAGKKQLNRAAGDRRLRAHPQDLLVTVPDGYVSTFQQGPDFEVYHLRKIVPFPNSPAIIGIYLGDWPGKNEADMKENGSAVLFGKHVHWYEHQIDEEGEKSLFDRALIQVRSGFGNGHSYVDIFVVAQDAAGIDELKKIAATARFDDSAKPAH